MNRMKKLTMFLGTILTSTLLMATLAMANAVPAEDFNLIFNGEAVVFEADAPPVIRDGSTLLPLRFLFNLLNSDESGVLEWDGATQEITIAFGETEAKLWIGVQNAVVNGVDTPINGAAPILFNNRTYVPLRFLADTFDMTTGWDAASRTASAIDNATLDRIMEIMEGSSPTDLEDLRMSIDMYMDMSVSVIFGEEEEEVEVTIEGVINIDLAEMFSHIHMTTVAMGETVVVDQFDDGEWTFISTGDEVLKAPSAFAELGDLSAFMEQFEAFSSLELHREFYTAFNLEVVGGTYVLSGPVFITDEYFAEMLALMGDMGAMVDDILGGMSLNIRSFYYRLVVDQETGILTSMEMQFDADITMEVEGVEMFISIAADIRMPNFDFDPTFESVVPQEIIDAAVEMEI